MKECRGHEGVVKGAPPAARGRSAAGRGRALTARPGPTRSRRREMAARPWHGLALAASSRNVGFSVESGNVWLNA